MTQIRISQFNTLHFFKAIIPSYVFPFISSALPGYFLNKSDLIHASYSTIAIPSLLSTVLCFGLLWQFQKKQIFLFNRFAMSLFLSSLMIFISLCIISSFHLQTATWYILPSVFIGATITTITKPLKKLAYNNEKI